MTETKKYHIDAAGKSMGRVASEAAKALMGKTNADYTSNVRSNVLVTIDNAARIPMREKKTIQKTYVRYTGYPGGLKSETYAHLQNRKPNEALRRAIERMLPKNTFRTPRMKNLTINS